MTSPKASLLGWRGRRHPRQSRLLRLAGLACVIIIIYSRWSHIALIPSPSTGTVTSRGLSLERLREDFKTCAKLRTRPSDPIGLGRERNSRYIAGHKPTLIRNATVWVGEPAEGTAKEDARSGQGYSWKVADIYFEHGLIKNVSKGLSVHMLPEDVLVYDAKGRPLTSGIIDMHSHVGTHGLPTLRGNDDTSELSTDITPYVRITDGIQPTDHQIK